MKKITALVVTFIFGILFIGCSARENAGDTSVTTTVPETTTVTTTVTTTTTTPASSTTTTNATTTTSTTKSSVTSTTTAGKSGTATTTTKNSGATTTVATTKNSGTTTTTATTTVSTTTTTVPKAEPVKKRVKLYVQNLQQCPELPMGCEAVSASIALKWYGFKVDKFSLLPYQPMMEAPTKDGVWGDPNEVFVGNPRTYKYGCYSPVIKKALEAYFEANHVDDFFEVISLDGSEFTDLYQEIDKGNPIILWVTTWMQDLGRGESWKLKDGSTFTWTLHEHCVVLIGYDTERDTVIISDPYDSKGTVEYPRSTVEKVYKQLNNMALVIHRKDSQ